MERAIWQLIEAVHTAGLRERVTHQVIVAVGTVPCLVLAGNPQLYRSAEDSSASLIDNDTHDRTIARGRSTRTQAEVDVRDRSAGTHSDRVRLGGQDLVIVPLLVQRVSEGYHVERTVG